MLEKIQGIATEYGIFISYEIVNQVNNGESKSIEKGLIPKSTFTVYVTDSEGEEIDIESHDNLVVALKKGIEIAERYILNKNNDTLCY